MHAYHTFNPKERLLWLISVVTLFITFIVSGSGFLNLIASLIGVTALIYLAKGEPMGHVLTMIFGTLYAIISYQMSYYGEMMTYLGMTLPSALFALYAWLKNPHQKGKTVVRIGKINRSKVWIILLLSPLITILFYFLLRFLNTPLLIVSTVSIFTSIVASLLMFFRIRYYAIAYAANDVVLIVLWVFAAIQDVSYLPMILCFIIFLINDLYAFFNWKKLSIDQARVSV